MFVSFFRLVLELNFKVLRPKSEKSIESTDCIFKLTIKRCKN